MFSVHLFSKLIHKFVGIQHIMFLYFTKIYGLDISLLKNHIDIQFYYKRSSKKIRIYM